MKKSIALSAVTALVAASGLAVATTAHADEPPAGAKVWVCKYVQAPGEAEVLKEGKNPISVSYNATEFKEYKVGAEFSDGQERSVVIALDTDPEPTAADCPAPATEPSEPPATETPEPSPSTEPSEPPATTEPPTSETPAPSTPASPEPTKPSDDDDDKPTTKPDPDRGVPAETGADGDFAALAAVGAIGAAGLAASGGALIASRRKR